MRLPQQTGIAHIKGLGVKSTVLLPASSLCVAFQVMPVCKTNSQVFLPPSCCTQNADSVETNSILIGTHNHLLHFTNQMIMT